MRAIEALYPAGVITGTALDVGTGSGILAFAMAAMGARVTAIDIDGDAIENARANAALNQPLGIDFWPTPLNKLRSRFDLITANILSGVLVEMAPRLCKRLKAGGHLVMAGILARETDGVRRAFKDLRLITISRSRGWATLTMAS